MKLLLAALLPLVIGQGALDIPKALETDIFKNYNRQHRPVKKEQTTIQVSVFLTISHVERVDEREQTMLVHGYLWAFWKDEYLQWNATNYNGTNRILIEAWRVWQPALALYNSARGNSWHLYMNGMPATVTNQGKVWVSGAFSFHVTCRFDFSSWPYDEQNCPIVISDWVYDLSRVNLSESAETPFSKPSIRLNYDPWRLDEKRHVAGWEVMDTWRKHCYWGPSGCKEEIPEGQLFQPEWYWSLLEFGIKIRRHAPYLLLTIVLPSIITCLLTLASFWIDNVNVSVCLLIFNILLQGLFGWDLIRELPPGSGGIPKIVTLYGFNLTLCTISFVWHVVMQYLEFVLPPEVPFPKAIMNLPAKLKLKSVFESKGISFDPQLLLNTNFYEEDQSEYNSPLAGVNSGSLENPNETLVEMENNEKEDQKPTTSNQEGKRERLESLPPLEEDKYSVHNQLYFIRRLIFCVYVCAYLIMMPYCLL